MILAGPSRIEAPLLVQVPAVPPHDTLAPAVDLSGSESWLFGLNLAIMFCNCLVMPLRESLILSGGKALQTDLMFYSTFATTLGTMLFSSCSERLGGHQTLFFFLLISIFMSFATWACLSVVCIKSDVIPGAFYLYFSFYNMASTSMFWIIAGDILAAVELRNEPSQGDDSNSNIKGGRKRFIRAFGKFAAGGTLGQMLGSSLSSFLAQTLKTTNSLLAVSCSFAITALLMQGLIFKFSRPLGLAQAQLQSTEAEEKTDTSTRRLSWKMRLEVLVSEAKDAMGVFWLIAQDRMLALAFVYSVLLSLTLGLFTIERQLVAKRTSLSKDDYASLLGYSLLAQGVLQFFLQYLGTAVITQSLGTRMSCALSAAGRLVLFGSVLWLQSGLHPQAYNWYLGPQAGKFVVTVLLVGDISCRIMNQTASKPLKESIWSLASSKAKSRAKIVIDVFAHRLGTSAAALLSGLDVIAMAGLARTGREAGVSAVETHIAWGAAASVVYVGVAWALGQDIDARTAASAAVITVKQKPE